MKDINEFDKERDEAFLSLDREKIINYMKKYELTYNDVDEFVFWVGVHYEILNINMATREQKIRSFTWLMINGVVL